MLLAALAAIRFPELPVLAILPAVLGASVAAVLPRDRGAWVAGLLAGAVLSKLPHSALLGLTTAAMPVLGSLLKRALPVRPGLAAILAVPAATYLAAAAGSGDWVLPLQHPLDLCTALAAGATLSVLAYAPTQREQLGPRGRAGFRLR